MKFTPVLYSNMSDYFPTFSLPHSTSSNSIPGSSSQPPKDFYVSIHPSEVTILNLNKLKRVQLLQPILELTLLSTKIDTSHFFSLTSTDDELSLITDTEILEQLKKEDKIVETDDYNTTGHTYRVLQFHEGMSGVTHTGVVEYLSKLFSVDNIAIIYINTFNNNFILISSLDFEKCNTILKKHNYVF